MTSPELPTHSEEKQIASMIETNVDVWIEQKNPIHEVDLMEDDVEEVSYD